MILVVDIGNTNIVLGVYRGSELLHHFRLSTARGSTVDEYGVMIHNLFNMSNLSFRDVEGSSSPPLFRRSCRSSWRCVSNSLARTRCLWDPVSKPGLICVMRTRAKWGGPDCERGCGD